MKPEAGQWWCMKDEPSVMVWSVGLSACGNWVIEWSDGTTSMSCPDDFYHEPRCTGWDWVVPEDQPQPAEDPDEWVILDSVNYANHIPRVGIDEFSTGNGRWQVQKAGHCNGTVAYWKAAEDLIHRCRRRDLPKVEQVKTDAGHDWSYHEKQKPQPKKTMLRLWIDSDCNIHAGLKGDRDLELLYDHETRQFYTEEQR